MSEIKFSIQIQSYQNRNDNKENVIKSSVLN